MRPEDHLRAAELRLAESFTSGDMADVLEAAVDYVYQSVEVTTEAMDPDEARLFRELLIERLRAVGNESETP